jgi:uncharacterized membrane protein
VNTVVTAAVVLALIGSALIGGVFFAFSTFIMKALARVPTSEGIAAMQSINVVVLNKSFLGMFLGTAVISMLVAGLAIKGWGAPSSNWLLAGALFYFIGTFLVTGLGNVPLNEQLATVTVTDANAVTIWEHYLDRWTLFNTVRTVAATAAAFSFTVGLMQHAS